MVVESHDRSHAWAHLEGGTIALMVKSQTAWVLTPAPNLPSNCGQVGFPLHASVSHPCRERFIMPTSSWKN